MTAQLTGSGLQKAAGLLQLQCWRKQRGVKKALGWAQSFYFSQTLRVWLTTHHSSFRQKTTPPVGTAVTRKGGWKQRKVLPQSPYFLSPTPTFLRFSNEKQVSTYLPHREEDIFRTRNKVLFTLSRRNAACREQQHLAEGAMPPAF